MLWKRILSAAIGIPVLIFAVYQGGLLFIALLAILTFFALYEFHSFIEKKGINLPKVIFITNGLIFILIAVAGIKSGLIFDFFLFYVLISFLISQLLIKQKNNALLNSSLAFLGTIYVGWLSAHFIYLRNLSGGFFYVILVLLVTWANDTGAYFIGINFGKVKLCPKISPNKTVEGAIGGLIFSLIACLIIGGLWVNNLSPDFNFSLVQLLILGTLISLAAQLGDLVESLFKRDAGVKDSSNLIPGHGGILDRFDSLLFAAPVVYYYLRVFIPH